MGLVLLALGAAAQAAMAPTEYTYQVTASIVLPGHGFHGYDMDVRLSTMPADWHATLPGAPKAAARAVRLRIERMARRRSLATSTRHGRRHPRAPRAGHSRDFYCLDSAHSARCAWVPRREVELSSSITCRPTRRLLNSHTFTATRSTARSSMGCPAC